VLRKEKPMQTRTLGLAALLALFAATQADAQVVSGVMTVTGAEMH
jgi:hypothetical protein